MTQHKNSPLQQKLKYKLGQFVAIKNPHSQTASTLDHLLPFLNKLRLSGRLRGAFEPSTLMFICPSRIKGTFLGTSSPSALRGRAAGGRPLRVALVLLVLLVLDGLGAAVRVAVVVEEAAEGELVEGVFRVPAVAEPAGEGVVVVVLVVAVVAPQLIGVHGVEVGGVRGVGDGGDVRRHLLPRVAGEVGGSEESVSFDFVGAVLTQSVLGASAQFNYEV